MNRVLTTIFALSLSTLAWGQEFTLWGDSDGDDIPETWQLEAVPGTYYENGLGKPTVAWDGSQWVMYFETWADPDAWPDDLSGWDSADFASCPGGKPVWLIGRATSPDGLTWTVGDPAVMPAADTYYACQAAHPTVVYDGTTWHMWFKSQQAGTECDDGTEPDWGCSQFTGVGYATSSDGAEYIVHDYALLFSDWIEEYSSFGYPSVAAFSPTGTSEFQWLMLISRIKTSTQTTADKPYQRSGDIMAAIADDPAGPWTAEPLPVFEAGFLEWISDRVYSPSLLCEDATTGFPYTMFFGGKQKVEDGDLRGIGLARGEWDDWYIDSKSPFYQWPKGENWTGWDSVRVGSDYLVWYAAKDDDNNNRINLAYSSPSTTWPGADISDRICDIFIDVDGDGYEPPADCNDADAQINPDADEECDDIDNDCDDEVDEGLDCDEDNYADPEDCDDDNPAVNPGATEICENGIDDDCDDEIDEAGCYIDSDGDGWSDGDDCEPNDPDINPGADEICDDGVDNDCDGDTDEDDEDCQDTDTDTDTDCDTGIDDKGCAGCNKDECNNEATAIPAVLLLPLLLGLRRRRRR